MPENPISKIPSNFAYKIPKSLEIADYLAFIIRVPEVDSPEVLGLHPNADLTFRFKEVRERIQFDGHAII